MSKQVDYNQKVLEVSNLKEHFKVGVGKNKLIVPAVDGVDFDIYKKEVFGLVGESGCGKTTTGRTIMRLYKPTNGTVKLNGNIIGSGSQDNVEMIKKAKQDFRLERLALNQYKYDRHLIKEKYVVLKAEFHNKIKEINESYDMQEQEMKLDIDNYNKAVFEEKNKFKVDNDRIHFAFKVSKEKIVNKTKNEYLVEYKQVLKGVQNSFRMKYEGIEESAGLSNELKLSHKKALDKAKAERLEELKAEFASKIESRSKSLLSNEDAKVQIAELKSNLAKEKVELTEKHKQYLSTLVKPNKAKIMTEVIKLKKKRKDEINLVRASINELSVKESKELNSVTSSKEVDKAQLEKITNDFKKFKEEQKELIRESRRLQNSKEAIENVKAMQMIFQDPISSLNPRMIVQEIVSEGLVINGEKDKELMEKKVKEALKLVGLAPEYISRYPHEFSGGQRQRIGIARALIMNPSIIVADEPISALDVSIKAQVINLLSELREQLDLTILFIAHDLSVVKFFCDRIAVMYFGKIVELASSEELFKNPLHPYTKSLLSAIPHPDPDSEKKRQRIAYSPMMHNYSTDLPEFVEIKEGHFVRANKEELKQMKKELGVTNESK